MEKAKKMNPKMKHLSQFFPDDSLCSSRWYSAPIYRFSVENGNEYNFRLFSGLLPTFLL